MKTFLKYAVLMFLVMASGKLAHASVLNGTITFGGGAAQTATGVTFNPSTDKIKVTGTGDLSSFTAGMLTSFTPNFSYALITSTPGGAVMFTVDNSTYTQKLQFKVTGYSISGGKTYYYGVMSLYTHAGVLISSNNTTMVYTQRTGLNDFTGDVSTAPEPNSLVLLGTGLVSAAGMMLRRRRTVQA